MQYSKPEGVTIELYLVNGTADGVVTAELSNWNGKAIKVPRTKLQAYTHDDIKGTGVYFLFCEDNNGVYIGEAENVAERLFQHIRDYSSGKETFYWNSAVIFTGRDLNKAYIRYLENKLVEISRQNKNANLLTKKTYKNTVLKESQISTLDTFIYNVKILIRVLGYQVLEEAPTPENDTTYFYCQGNGVNARGFLSNKGFTILKDAKVSDHIAPSFETHGLSYFKLRQKLEKDGIVIDRVFQKNYEFSSPSAASSVIEGRPTNGNIEWKTEKGVKLKDFDTSAIN